MSPSSIMFSIFWRLLLILALIKITKAFNCHSNCTCIWRNGKQTAECHDRSMDKVPLGLDSGVQVLHLSRNKLSFLPSNVFLSAGLVNLQKVYLSKCGIDHIDDSAFNKTSNLIELDLSDNKIALIPTPIFQHVQMLRTLTLSGNPITEIPTLAFSNLMSLITLELSNCKLSSVSVRAFKGLANLKLLKLDGNNLQTFPGKALHPLTSLQGINIDGNPWRCDCELRMFRQWLDKQNVPYHPPVCSRPVRLKGKLWDIVDIFDYACEPKVFNTTNEITTYEGSNVTLECKIFGDPVPEIQWLWRERVIANLSEGISSQQTFLVKETITKEKLSQLTITSVQEPNAGSYKCIAENSAGKVAVNFSLTVTRRLITEVGTIEKEKSQEVKKESETSEYGYEGRSNPIIGLVVGIIIGALIVLLIFGIILWVCRKKRSHRGNRKRSDQNHKVGTVATHTTDGHEEANLKLLGVNPILKPPRLGAYETIPTTDSDHYDTISRDGGLSPQVWVVKYQRPPERGWERPPSVDPCLTTRTPGGPQEELQLRLQNEISDTIKRKAEKKVPERERGDGSSELETMDYDHSKSGNFETLRVRELEKSFQNGSNRFYSDDPPADPSPDLLDHPRKLAPQQNDTGGGGHWQSSAVQTWDPGFDHPSAYFRPPSELRSPLMDKYEGGSDGTEV